MTHRSARFRAAALTAGVALLLGGCMNEPAGPGAKQLGAWSDAASGADPAFVEADAEGPYRDGSVSSTVISVKVDGDEVTDAQARGVIDAVVAATDDENRESIVRIGFYREDAGTDTGTANIYLDGVLSADYVQGDQYIAIYATGSPVASGTP